MRRIAAPLSLGPTLALALALGACGPVNRGVESVHQPIVSRADFAMDVAVTASGLAAGEEQRLSGWFEGMRLGYGDRISIDDPAPRGHAAGRDAVGQVAAQYGLLVGADAPVTEGVVPAYAIRVVVSRSTARVDGCPDWRRLAQPEFASSTSSNYGCATNSNLAAMVANPEDLVRGQPGTGTGDPRAATKAITAYRTAEATGKQGLKSENTRQGGQ